MKSLKIVFASLFLAAGAVAFSSFTVKEFRSNAFLITCYDYTETVNIDLRAPQSTFIVLSTFKDVTKWQVNNSTASCAEGNKICRICFEVNDLASNNVTFSELLEDLHAYFATNGPIALNGTTIPLAVTGVAGSGTINVTLYEQTV